MRKTINFLAILVSVISIMGLCGCSKSSLNEEANKFLGTWNNVDNTKIQGRIITFNEDQTCIWEEYWNFEDLHEKGSDRNKGTWSYDASTRMLSYLINISYEGENYDISYLGIVTALTDNYFTVIDLGGNTDTWKR